MSVSTYGTKSICDSEVSSHKNSLSFFEKDKSVAECNLSIDAWKAKCPMFHSQAYKLTDSVHNVYQDDKRSSVCKKRTCTGSTVQTFPASDQTDENNIRNELCLLRKALIYERETNQKLSLELEEERFAATTAVNEAMSMISRLQDEKASILTKARQYRSAAEERESHAQETITLLKEALLEKQDELIMMHNCIEEYKEMVLRMKCNEDAAQEILYLKDKGCEEQLLLESQSSFMSPRAAETKFQQWNIPEIDTPLFGKGKANEQEVDSCETGTENSVTRVSRANASLGAYPDDETYSPSYLETEFRFNDRQEPNLESASLSILDRLRRLEERFDCLSQNRDLEYENHTMSPMSDAERPDYFGWDHKMMHENSSTELFNNFSYSPEHGLHTMDCNDCSSTAKVLFSADYYFANNEEGYDSPATDDAKDSVHDKFVEHEGYDGNLCRNSENFKKAAPSVSSDVEYVSKNETKLRDTSFKPHKRNKETLVADEGVHDVYEVCQEAIKLSYIPASEKLANGSHEHHGNQPEDMTLRPHELLIDAPDSSNAMVKKLSVGFGMLNVKDAHESVLEQDICQLRGRLEALESERLFMKQALESLNKENSELRLLKQHINETKDSAMKAEPSASNIFNGTQLYNEPEQQHPLPFFSYVKNFLPFVGSPSISTNTSDSRSSEPEPPGLGHLLQSSSCESPGSVCLTRSRKVNLARP